MGKDEKAGLYKPGHEADGLAAIARMLREKAAQATAASSLPTTPVSKPVPSTQDELRVNQTSVKKEKKKKKKHEKEESEDEVSASCKRC